MNNGDLPINVVHDVDGSIDTSHGLLHLGLTKREYFAGLAMQGLIASDPDGNISQRKAVELSIEYADELLKKLENNDG